MAVLAQAQAELAALTDMWQQDMKGAEIAGYQARIAAAGKTTVYLFYGSGMPSVSCNMNIG